MNGHPGPATGIGNALTCAHHIHTDRQILTCLATSWGYTVDQLCAILLALLLSKAEEDANKPARAPITTPAPRPATTAPPEPRRRRTTRPVEQRRAIVADLLRRSPNATGAQVRDELARAGHQIGARQAAYDLAAVRRDLAHVLGGLDA